jgi:hypothetical protein
MMNRNSLLSLLIVCLGLPAWAQNQAPAILHEVAHCLVTDSRNWLDPETLRAPELNLGFKADNKTALGDEYLYVVVYTTPKRDAGKIFDIRVKHHHLYSIENDATFVSSATGITFSTPPQGGQWAQNQLIPAIEGIVHHKWYTADMKYLRKPAKNVQCESNMETESNSATN